MGPAIYVIAILGCGEGDTACQPVASMPTRYADAASCEAATGDALMRHQDALFPVVVAQCRRTDDRMAGKVWSDEVRLPDASSQNGPAVRSAAYKPRRARS